MGLISARLDASVPSQDSYTILEVMLIENPAAKHHTTESPPGQVSLQEAK